MTQIRPKSSKKLLEYFPRKGPALYIIILIIVMAFFVGFLINPGNKDDAHKHDTNESLAQTGEPTIWTCSMHPQIKLPEPGKCPLCFMDLIPLDNSSQDELGERQLKMSEAAVKLAQITTSVVKRDYAEAEVRLYGKIEYDETRLAYISAWVPGRIDSLYADYTGIKVNPGDPLVKLYSPELLSAQMELVQSKLAPSRLKNDAGELNRRSTESTLKAAREKLKLLGLTDRQIETVESDENISDHVIINAPIGGVVVHIDARKGDYVKTGTPIYTIADLSTVWVLLDAYESDLAWIRQGQAVEFQSLALSGEAFTGKIAFIDPVLDNRTRTVKVRVVADNINGRLKPGMLATGIVKSRLDKDGNFVRDEKESNAPLLIPSSSPLITGARAVVYLQVSDKDGAIFEGREIELGPRAGDYYIVKSGLIEGDIIVTNGAFKLDSELQIQAKPSMMSPEGGSGSMIHDHKGHSPAMDQMSNNAKISSSKPELTKSSLAALNLVYDAYFAVQMALAADNLAEAKTGYSDLKHRTQSIDMNLFEGNSHGIWMENSQTIIKESEAGEKADNIEAARKAFLKLSQAMIELTKKLGHGGHRNFYLTFCPMADNNQGAYWLQTVDTVYNSFYGSLMLRCGSIKDTLKAK